MRCNSCKAEWNVSAAMSASIKTCPFCGADLYPKATGELDSLQAILKVIISHGGTESLKDGRRTLAMFSDLAPKLRKEKTMYSYLVQVEGNVILLDALKKSRSEQLVLRGRLAQDMVDTFLITEAVAFAACDSFWEAIGGEPFEQKQEASAPPQPVSPTVATGISTEPMVPSIMPQDISDDKAAQYQDALALFNIALTKEEFHQAESAFRSLGSYSNAAQMAARVSSEWASRSKRAQELYQAYQTGSTGRDPAAAVDREIAALQAQKADCERVQNSAPTLNAELEEHRRKRNTVSSEVTALKQKIAELESQKPKFSFWGGKEHAAQIESYQNQLRRLEEEYRLVCQQVASTQDAINSIPAPFQTRAKIQDIEAKIRQKTAERNTVRQHAYAGLSNFDAVRQQICDPKYLAILSGEPVKAMVLKKDPIISTAMARITNASSSPSAPSTGFQHSLEGMLLLVQSNSKVTEAERLQIFQKGKQLLAAGDKGQAIKLIKFAANKGLQDASLLIGECYETGNGVSKDLKIAEAFYRSVAVSGNHEGEYRLGKMLYHPQNRYGANAWLEKAARAGHRGAANLLKYGK